MISFGLRMQGQSKKVPHEVATWLFQQTAKYPLIDFQLEYEAVTTDRDTSEINLLSIIKQYCLLFGFSGKGWDKAVKQVSFLYTTGIWKVNIFGVKGDVGEPDPKRAHLSLSPEQRSEISGFKELEGSDALVEINPMVFGKIRTIEPEVPTDFIALNPEYSMTSELSLTALNS
ncbi:MAG: hypothetical protein ACP5N9_00030 [Candidatus Bilamarchaeum sp.]